MRTYVSEHADSDVLFVWTESNVLMDQQYDLSLAGINSLRAFSGLEDTRPLARATFARELTLDATAGGPAGRAATLALSALVGAWEIAVSQLARETALRAEAKVLRINRVISVQDKHAMRKAVEARHGSIPNREVPSTDYLSCKVEECENNEPVASPLDEVTSMLDADTSTVTANLDLTGKIQVLRKRIKASLPANPEELRLRLRIERHCWLFMASKFNNKPWLFGLQPRHFDTWTDYFLGPRVMLLEIPTPEGGRVALHPPWSIILSYEYYARRRVFEHILEDGWTMIAAMESATTDADLKEICFTSPIALMGRGVKRTHDATVQEEGKGKNRGRGKGRGRGKSAGRGAGGKGKGKGRGQIVSKAPDGRSICFDYNGPQGCQRGAACTFLHICQRKGCGGAHPLTEHEQAAGA